jgi:uncharacterized DUF497 family protein
MHTYQVEFEFDAVKSKANQEKHGLDFVGAQALWADAGLVILPSRYADESRYLAIGRIGQQHWTAIFTERGNTVRLISVRRARDNEKRLYEQNES